MSGTTDINIVLAQGDAVTEVQNIRKQVLDLGQQSIVQNSQEQKKQVKSKVQKFQAGDRIEISLDQESREELKRQKKGEKGKPAKPDEKDAAPSSGNLIDIKV